MEQSEREFFAYRLIAGYYRYSVAGKQLKILVPSPDVMYEAQELFLDTLQEAREQELATEKDMDLLMRERGLWSDYDEDQLTNVLPKHVEFWKTEIYNKFDNKKELKRIELHLDVARKALNELFTRKHSFDHYTQNGVAMFARWQRIVELTTVDSMGHPYDFEDVNIPAILDFISRSTPSEEIVRDIVRNDPWRSMWMAAKRSGGNLFGVPSVQLSDDQRRAINWAGLYDNVSEYPDAPSDAIFAHHDAFDGWLILKNRENEKSRREEAFKKKNSGGTMDAPEVFMVMNKEEDDPDKFRDTVYGMNDPTSRLIVNNRLQTVSQMGVAKDTDFADVQRGITRDVRNMNRKG